MTPHLTPTLPADTNDDPIAGSTPGPRDVDHGKEVEAMTRSRRSRKRAWDEMSETDRQVLLESVRRRREMQAARDAQELSLYAMRTQR